MLDAPAQTSYLWVALLGVAAFFFGLAPILIARLWGGFANTQRPDENKNAIYECGLEAQGDAWFPLKPEYYLYGITFLIFDVEVLFLLPIAAVYKHMPLGACLGALVFVLLLLEGLIWAWAKGLLEWQNPQIRTLRPPPRSST